MNFPEIASVHHGLFLALAMLLGTILHTFRYVRSVDDLKGLGKCVALSLLGLLPGKRERDYHLETHLITVAGWFAFTTAFLFRKRIIGTLTEQYLLHINIVYAFFLLTHLRWYGPESPVLLLALLPSVHTLVLILHPKTFKTGINIVSFLWFFVMNIVMLIGSFWQFFIEILTKGAESISLWQGLTMGPMFFLLMAYSVYIWELIPYPRRHQTYAQRLKDVKLFIRELDRAYDPIQLRMRHSIFIIVVEGGLLWINHVFKLVDPTIAINLSLILFSILLPNSNPPKRIDL